MDPSIGMIEVEGVAPVIAAGDAAAKAASVELLGWESIGGYTTIFFTGSLSDVAAALQAGKTAAEALTESVVAVPLSRPVETCRNFLDSPTQQHVDVRDGALGLLEARGYGVHAWTNDAMVKAAPVAVENVLTVHNRIVCSLIRGEVDAVREAIAVGRELLREYEHFLCATVIPQPVPDVLRTFGRGAALTGGEA
jgi:ethanolamine utilization protein EutM